MDYVMIALIDLLLWPLMKLVKILILTPILIAGFFKHKKRCTPVDDNWLLIPANILVKKIVNKEISCVELVRKYICRIEQVNPLINAVIERRYATALEEAGAVDRLVSDNNPQELLQRYPLLGIPITVKESLMVKGMSNTAGCVNAREKIAKFDADIVAAVKNAGAIIMVLTNTPELCLNWETSNNLFGTTCNPYDTRRTAGGSSGGEAALIASGGSLIGLGSDIAGSLRMPAHYCGIFSHKPSMRAVSVYGHYPSSSDTEVWKEYFSVGPMVRYASDLPLLYKVLISPEYKPLLNFDEEVNLSTLKIYYWEHCGSFLCKEVDIEIIRTMKMVISHLRDKFGVETVKLDVNMDKCTELSLLPLVNIKNVDDIYYDKPRSGFGWELIKYFFCSSKSTFTGIMYFLLTRMLNACLPQSVFDKYIARKDKLREKIEKTLGDNGVLICPSYPSVANYHFATFAQLFEALNCLIFNALGFPVTSCHVSYNQQGMPMGLQVAAKRNFDRLTIAVAQEIEIAFGGWQPSSFQ